MLSLPVDGCHSATVLQGETARNVSGRSQGGEAQRAVSGWRWKPDQRLGAVEWPWWRRKTEGTLSRKCPRGLHQICDRSTQRFDYSIYDALGQGTTGSENYHDDPFRDHDGEDGPITGHQWTSESSGRGEDSGRVMIVSGILVGNAGGRRRML